MNLGGVLDYEFELLRTIHTGIVAVAEWYNFRIPAPSLGQHIRAYLAGSSASVDYRPRGDQGLPRRQIV